MRRNVTLAIFAIAAALGLLGIVALEMIVLNQEASAGCENKKPSAFDKAVLKGKCSPPVNSSPS